MGVLLVSTELRSRILLKILECIGYNLQHRMSMGSLWMVPVSRAPKNLGLNPVFTSCIKQWTGENTCSDVVRGITWERTTSKARLALQAIIRSGPGPDKISSSLIRPLEKSYPLEESLPWMDMTSSNLVLQSCSVIFQGLLWEELMSATNFDLHSHGLEFAPEECDFDRGTSWRN